MLVALVALAVLIATATFSSQLFAQSPPGTISGLTLTSNNPGELVVSWDIPSETPSDYRISWAPSDEPHASWKAANTSTKGNSYPAGTSTSLTLTGLPEGEIYKVRMRARYNAGQYADNPWSGPWAKTTGTVSSTPVPTPVPEPTSTPVPEPTEEPVEETTPPTMTLSATTPVVGKSLTATLVDPDALVSGESWSWSKTTTITSTFTAITVATSAIYTPVVQDVGSYLRATASYTDSSESDQSVSVDSTDATIANPSPIFADTLVTFSVMENVTTGEVGTVTATDPDNDTLTYSVSGTDAAEFDGDFILNASSGAITVKSNATIDYESKSSYAITITVTDTFGGTDTIEVTITVGDGDTEESIVLRGNIQNLTIVDSSSEPEQIDVSWVGPTDPPADRFQIAWTFEGMEYTGSRDRNVTTQDEEFTITGVSELTSYAIRVRAHFETEEDEVYAHGPWLEAVHTTAALPEPTPTPEPTIVAPEPPREPSTNNITGLITLVSNSGLPGTTESAWVNPYTTVSQKFRTGSAEQGYTLSEVELELTPKAGNAAVTLSVHASSGPSYGARLFELTPPADLDADVDVFTAPANSVLQPNTDYWLVIKNANGSTGEVVLVLSDSDTTDDSTLDGFTVSRMNVDIDATVRNSRPAPPLGEVADALGGGTSDGGIGETKDAGTKANPSAGTGTNVVRMVISGQQVGDVPSGITSQMTLTLGEAHQGSTDFLNDHDWYRVELEAGVRYVFDAYLNDPRKPDPVWLYGIYNSNGNSLEIEYVHRHVLRDYLADTGARVDFDPKGRAYFMPSSTGTYFVATGVRHTKTANYRVIYAEADTETKDTTTPAFVASGSVYHGEFFTPHGTSADTKENDVDWIRVSLLKGENYLFLVDVPGVFTKVEILAVYGSAGAGVSNSVYAVSQPSRDDGEPFRPNNSWVTANFTPTASGDYYVEVTGSSAERKQIVITSDTTPIADCIVTPPAITPADCVASSVYVTDDRYFGSVYDFYLWGTDQPNVDEDGIPGDKVGHGSVFTEGFINTDNSAVTGRIRSNEDVDWYRVWLDEGERYLISVNDADNEKVRLDGVWQWPNSDLIGSFNRGFNFIDISSKTRINTRCGYSFVTSEETGFHFIQVLGRTGDYRMSIYPYDGETTTSESSLGADLGTCAPPGYLFDGDSKLGTFNHNEDKDAYIVWMRTGVRYKIEARGLPSNLGSSVDPDLRIYYPSGHLDATALDISVTDYEAEWNEIATETGIHTLQVEAANNWHVGDTYTIIFTEIGVVNEPDYADYMPNDKLRAGYVTVDQNLRGNLTPGDQYDGFRIVTIPGKSYTISAQAVNLKNWAGNNLSEYDDMYLTVRRFDGTNYVDVESSVDNGYIVKDRYRDSGIHLHFEAEEPPTGVTYEYLGEVRAWNAVQQLYVGGYTITLREDDRREIVDAGYYPKESGETIVDRGIVWGNIETAGDYDSFVFDLVSGKEYRIEVKSDHSSDGRTVDNIVVDSLKWISGLGAQKTTGGLDSATLAAEGDTSNGEFIMTYTPTISGLHILTVKSADGNTGTYTIKVRNLTATLIRGPSGKAVVGQQLSALDAISDLIAFIDSAQTIASRETQWLRDGNPIPGATVQIYTLTEYEVGKRISIHITYTLDDGSTGELYTRETSRVVDKNRAFVRNLGVSGADYVFTDKPAVMWLGFETGYEANGYMLERVVIKFSGDSAFTGVIPKDEFSVSLEGTGSNSGSNYVVKDDHKFRFHHDFDFVRGQDFAFHAPAAAVVLRDTPYHISLRETHSGGWSCLATGENRYDGHIPGWEMQQTVTIEPTDAEATTSDNIISIVRCRFGVFGRKIGGSKHLTSIDITNSPTDGNGFVTGDTVEVTAVFNKLITGTLTMSLDIGDRTTKSTVTGNRINTFVFRFEVLATDTDNDGITFRENVLHGFVDADLGHNDIQPDAKNRLPVASQGPTGRAAIGGVLTANPLSEYATSLGETHTGHTYQWLRDGEDIPGETGDTYTLVADDTGKRISTRVSYMAGGSPGKVNSNATPFVAGASVLLIGNTGQNPDSGWTTPGDSAVQWVGFTAGTNPNGYTLDRVRVMYHEHTDFAAEISVNEYKAAIELADSTSGDPIADNEIAELLVQGPIRRGQSGYFQAPPVLRLDPEIRYNLALREFSDEHSSCKSADKNRYNSGGQPEWTIRDLTKGHAVPDSMITDKNHPRPCGVEFHGRVINPDAVSYLTALDITNTPVDGDGFVSGNVVQVTAVLSSPITGTLTMSIHIGRREVIATAVGVDTDTFVFSYTILSTDVDGDGITFDKHVLQFSGWLALDLGHDDLWPMIENSIVSVIPGPMGKAIVGQEITIGSLTKLESKLGETPTSYAHQWLRDGEIIAGATGNAYTLVKADQNTRIRTRTEYTLADATTGMMESQETSVVISGTRLLVGNHSVPGSDGRVIESGKVYFSQGFTTGGHASGYMIDRTHVRFSRSAGVDNKISVVPKDEYRIHLMTARENFTGSGVVALLHNEGNAILHDLSFHQAPPGTELIPNARYTVVMTEVSPDHRFSCEFTSNRPGRINSDSLQDWGIRNIFNHRTTIDIFARHVFENPGSCKIVVTGRLYAENVPHLRSLDITNTPEDGDGFISGDTVEVTAKFTGPITGTLTMPIEIGDRTITAAAEGENTDTFVFEYEILNTDADANGITFGTDVLHGSVAADVGHTDLWPNPENAVNAAPVITGIRVTSAPDDPAVGYTTGEDMDLTFTFDKPIEVTGTGIRLTMTFIEGQVDPLTCSTSDWYSSLRYDAEKSTSTTMVFSAVVIDDIHDDQGWVNNNDIQLHGGTVTDGWQPAGFEINADLSYHRGGSGINYPFNIDSRTACNN